MRKLKLTVLFVMATLAWGTSAYAQSEPEAAETESSADAESTSPAPEAPAAEAAEPTADADDSVETATTPESSDTADSSGTALGAPSDSAQAPAPEEAAESGAAGLSGAADEEASDAESAAESGESESAAAAPSGPLMWRNSFFSWTQAATFNSFVRDGQLSYNPSYQMNFSFTPRLYIAPMTFFWFNQGLGFEVTDTDGFARNRDPQLTDTIVDLRHIQPWEGFVFIGAVRLTAPTSKISQAQQRYFNTGLGLTVVRPVSEANLTIAAFGRWAHWFAGSNVPLVADDLGQDCAPRLIDPGNTDSTFDPSGCPNGQGGDQSSPSDIFVYGLNLVWVPIPGLSFSATGVGVTLLGHSLATGCVTVETSSAPVCIEDGSPTHWRNFTYYSLAVSYEAAPFLNLTLGVQNTALISSLYNPDGSVRNPLFTPDTSAFLTATIQVDGLYEAIIGGDDEEGLTPEERQRRRQGLALGESEEGAF